jgi:signal peptidase I
MDVIIDSGRLLVNLTDIVLISRREEGERSKMTGTPWMIRIQKNTEIFLTWRKRRKLAKKVRQKQKNPILDWVEVIISAVLIVFLINQFLFQAYQIPSGSMEHTLNIKDRIFVNKFIYGPELIPGMFKINGFTVPGRGEIIIFENPHYIPRGPFFDIAHRLIYMLTFTLIDIDKDEFGQPSHHFLIKRAVAVSGDRIRAKNGNMEFLPAGETDWITEQELQERTGLEYTVRRLLDENTYLAFETLAKAEAMKDAGLSSPLNTSAARSEIAGKYPDSYFTSMVWNRVRYQINPGVEKYGVEWRRSTLGWYIGEKHIFPMGDNRDNSRDARYFHAVKTEKVLGRASFRFWPIPRFGGIR